ncbi:MAG: tetratricopeptide repeat protein [Candidatus Omnitrophica bacterium]|nr:tetratricopeptide repeat protein [Candidatus Omnitrophota bacterium]
MKKVIINSIIIACTYLFITLFTVCYAASEGSIIREGNRLFKNEQFDAALQKYNEANVAQPDSDVIHFNIGTAKYKKGDYEGAIDSFTKTLMTDDSLLEAKSNYNIGNGKYRQGKLKENTDLGTAVNLFRDALSYYKRAIELNKEDKEAKFNHEFAERKLKILLDKLKQQQEQQQQEQGKGKQQQQAQAAQGQQEEEKEQGAEGQQQKEEPDGEKQQAATTDESQAGQEGDEQKEAPQEGEEGQQDEMSEEEARMLLEGYRQEEESKGTLQQQSQRSGYQKVLKDW